MTYSTDVVTKGISISDIFEKLFNHCPKIRLGVSLWLLKLKKIERTQVSVMYFLTICTTHHLMLSNYSHLALCSTNILIVIDSVMK